MLGLFRSRAQQQEMEAHQRLAAIEQERRNVQAAQDEAAEFMRRHNCDVVIIKPDGTMLPG